MRESLQHRLTQKDIADAKTIHTRLESLTESIAEAGRLLKEVKERKLYLTYADSFKEYVEDVLGWTRQRGYQLIDASDVIESLPPQVSTIVDTETKARALSPVPPKQREQVVQEAVKTADKNGVPVTAKSITEAAQRVLTPAQQPPIDVEEVLYDQTGYRIPEHRAFLWKRHDEVKEQMRFIAQVRGFLRRVEGQADQLFKFVNIGSAMADLDRAYSEIKMALPFVVCPYCQGQTHANCTNCRTTGFMPEHIWKHAVPEELKAVRAKSCEKKG